MRQSIKAGVIAGSFLFAGYKIAIHLRHREPTLAILIGVIVAVIWIAYEVWAIKQIMKGRCGEMSKYPRVGEIGQIPHKGESGRIGLIGSRCCICWLAATNFVEIQYSWFRGDDSVYPLCDSHRSFPQNNLQLFLKYVSDYPPRGKNGRSHKKDE
jgi:hypothetical protein